MECAMAQRRDPESIIREIKRKTRRKFSSEEKIRIVLEGLRGEEAIAELCRREGINPNLYYNWSQEFLEAGKRRLAGNTKHEANSSEVLWSEKVSISFSEEYATEAGDAHEGCPIFYQLGGPRQMRDEDKTKEQLIQELRDLRQQLVKMGWQPPRTEEFRVEQVDSRFLHCWPECLYRSNFVRAGEIWN